MNIEKLFHVIVVVGASSTAGLAACDIHGSSPPYSTDDEAGSSGGSSGSTDSDAENASSSDAESSGGDDATSSTDTGSPGDSGPVGTTDSGGSELADAAGDGAVSCTCEPDTQFGLWTDCNGCCCWLPAGTAAPAGTTTPICGVSSCCTGKGR